MYMKWYSVFSFLGSLFSVLSSPIPEHCDILSLSGGGSFGAVEIGILDDLLEKEDIPRYYDVITGISAGGLNAAFLSTHHDISKSVKAIIPIYKELKTSDVYKQSYSIFKKWGWYDTTPLEGFIARVLNNTVMIPSIQPSSKKRSTLIGSTNLNTEKLEIHHFYVGDNIDRKVDILMATTAIPILFPPRDIRGEFHVDGGVLTNEMVTEALSFKKCKTYDIYLINAKNKKSISKEITGFTNYMKTLFSVFMNIFDNELSRINMVCMFSNTRLHIYYPNTTELEQFSILDFDHGTELYTLGKNHYYKVDKYIC